MWGVWYSKCVTSSLSISEQWKCEFALNPEIDIWYKINELRCALIYISGKVHCDQHISKKPSLFCLPENPHILTCFRSFSNLFCLFLALLEVSTFPKFDGVIYYRLKLKSVWQIDQFFLRMINTKCRIWRFQLHIWIPSGILSLTSLSSRCVQEGAIYLFAISSSFPHQPAG